MKNKDLCLPRCPIFAPNGQSCAMAMDGGKHLIILAIPSERRLDAGERVEYGAAPSAPKHP
jgi:hypothetical protein